MPYSNNSSPSSLDMLCDPATASSEYHVLSSPPLSPQRYNQYPSHPHPSYLADVDNNSSSNSYGKPRNRFSEYEDAVICEGVAKGLTWGQISGKLPHRKRATCFNRYRTLQGIRKSRKRLVPSYTVSNMLPMMNTPPNSRRASICSQQAFFTPSPSPPLSTVSMTSPLSSSTSVNSYATSSMQQRAPRIINTTTSCIGADTTSRQHEWMMRNQSYRHGWMEQQQSPEPSRYAGRRGYF